jgi:outer membrane protein assembly factor BamB
VVDDPDAIWKPGYGGPPPVFGSTHERSIEQPHDGADRAEPARRRRRGRKVAAGVVLGLLVIVAVVAVDPFDSSTTTTPPDPSMFGGPAARRLPDGAALLWSTDLPSEGDHWADVVGRELVLAAVIEPTGADSAATTMVAFDAPTGERRWTKRLPGRPRDVSVIGAVDGVLVLEQPGVNGPTVTGVDVATGATRWTADDAPNGGHLGLLGTPFIARLPTASDRVVTLFDASSGDDVGTLASELAANGRPAGWSTDGRGRWYVIDDGDVVEYDLRSELGEGSVIGRMDDVSSPSIVLDGRLALVDDSGSITLHRDDDRGPLAVSAEVPGPVRTLTWVSGSSFVVTSPGSIAGIVVDGDTLEVSWSQNRGAAVDQHPVEGGMLLQVATRGGAATQIVDGLSGETIEHLTMVPGALQALVVAGDGVVVLRTSDVGTTLTGIDLDGSERWSIPGSAPVVVGDRIMARATTIESGDGRSAPSRRQLRVTSHGDVD